MISLRVLAVFTAAWFTASIAYAETALQGPLDGDVSLQHPAQLASSVSSQFAPFQPRIDAGGKLGSDRSLLMTEGWAPLWQDDFNVFYGDIRVMADDRNNEEYNLGFGYRALRGSQIGGLHAWVDKRDTQLGSTFYQATLGAELLTLDTDFRVNMYIPLTGTKHRLTPNIGSSTPYLAGSGIYYDTNGIFAEEPQKGMDMEAGYRLPILKEYVDAFRVYGGGYAFLGNETDDVIGLRARTQIDVNPWLSVGARIQRDDERGTQGFLEATLRFPVTSKKMIQREGVRARMDESPERDVDIVTGAKQVDTGLKKAVRDPNTGEAQRILYVNNTAAAGGDGSIDNPFNTLKTAEAQLQFGDTIYVYAGDGNTTNQDQGLVIAQDGVQLIGSGVDFILLPNGKLTSGDSGAYTGSVGQVLITHGVAPSIANYNNGPQLTEGNGVLITANNAFITGISVNGTKSGIAVIADNRTISNTVIHHEVNASGFLGAGLSLNAINNGSIQESKLSRSTVRMTSGTGLALLADSNGKIENTQIERMYALGTGGLGFDVNAKNSGAIRNLVMDSNTSDTMFGPGTGLRLSGETFGVLENLQITNQSLMTGGTATDIVNDGTATFTNVVY